MRLFFCRIGLYANLQTNRATVYNKHHNAIQMQPPFLPSATKLRRLCFYTCLSCCSQGGGLPQCMLGYHTPPRGTPPWEAPPPQEAHHPWKHTHPPREAHPTPLRTHPTGMHSCLKMTLRHLKHEPACEVPSRRNIFI